MRYLAVYEMCHKLPPPLAPRTFPVLVVQALEEDANGGQARTGLVVHVPIDISDFPGAMYSNGRNVKEGEDSQKQKKVVLGYPTLFSFSCLRGCCFLANVFLCAVHIRALNASSWLRMMMWSG